MTPKFYLNEMSNSRDRYIFFYPFSYATRCDVLGFGGIFVSKNHLTNILLFTCVSLVLQHAQHDLYIV